MTLLWIELFNLNVEIHCTLGKNSNVITKILGANILTKNPYTLWDVFVINPVFSHTFVKKSLISLCINNYTDHIVPFFYCYIECYQEYDIQFWIHVNNLNNKTNFPFILLSHYSICFLSHSVFKITRERTTWLISTRLTCVTQFNEIYGFLNPI